MISKIYLGMVIMKEYLYVDSNDDSHQARFKVSNTPKIDYLIKERKFSEALGEIDELLKTDSSHSNWNLKGMILCGLSEFEKSIDCFNMALDINQSEDVQLNKANAYYSWSKVTFFPEGDYDKALNLIDEGLDALPDSEDPSEYYFLKAEILEALNELAESHKCYLKAYKEFDRLREFEKQTDYLNETSDTLVNIVGCDFYNYSPKSGDIVGLVRDVENEHDPDAVAVTVDGETVGYVANNSYTLIDEVKSASDIKNSLLDNQKAEILFVYLGQYVIAKLN